MATDCHMGKEDSVELCRVVRAWVRETSCLPWIQSLSCRQQAPLEPVQAWVYLPKFGKWSMSSAAKEKWIVYYFKREASKMCPGPIADISWELGRNTHSPTPSQTTKIYQVSRQFWCTVKLATVKFSRGATAADPTFFFETSSHYIVWTGLKLAM